MKLVTYSAGGLERLGALKDDRVCDLQQVAAAVFGDERPAFVSMLALIEGGDAALDEARDALEAAPDDTLRPMADVTLRAPIPVPPQMRDTLCFEKHLEQAIGGMAKLRAEMAGSDPEKAYAEAEAAGMLAIPQIFYDQPIYYKSNRFAVSGPDEEVPWPSYSKYMDYEFEIACVLGKGGKDIKADDAASHIFGYTIFNDFSARDAQAKETLGFLGPAKGKDFDKANAMGPVLITADEIPDVSALEMIVRVNGQEMSRGTPGTMHWTFAQVIEWISQGETMYPGEIIGSGTVGDGCGLEHFRFLRHGDVVELDCPQIGILRNRVTRSDGGNW